MMERTSASIEIFSVCHILNMLIASCELHTVSKAESLEIQMARHCRRGDLCDRADLHSTSTSSCTPPLLLHVLGSQIYFNLGGFHEATRKNDLDLTSDASCADV